MLSLCLRIMRAVAISKYKATGPSVEWRKASTKYNNIPERIAPNEAIEAIRKTPIITAHMAIARSPAHKFTANRHPRNVATPLPPLSLNHKGKRCPITALRQATPTKYSVCGPVTMNSLVMMIANEPFKISPNKTKMPFSTPAVLNTLLVPGFFEPCCLGSGNFRSLERITAESIDPSK